jgi:hypothetical protein
MTEMSEKEVLDACAWLEKDYAAGGLPDANSHYTDIYQMNDVAIVSSALAVLGVVAFAAGAAVVVWR